MSKRDEKTNNNSVNNAEGSGSSLRDRFRRLVLRRERVRALTVYDLENVRGANGLDGPDGPCSDRTRGASICPCHE